MESLWAVLRYDLACVVISMLFSSVYLHRYVAHGSVSRLNPVVALMMHFHLSALTGLSAFNYKKVHIPHHLYADTALDPHPPGRLGFWKVVFGIYYYYHKALKNPAIAAYHPEYQKDLIDKFPAIGYWGISGLLLSVAVASWRVGWHRGWWLGVSFWLIHFVLFMLLNGVVNACGHSMGYRRFKNHGATNLRILALVTGGDALHNNHHAWPGVARFSLSVSEIDPGWGLIRVLMLLGLAEANIGTTKLLPQD